jgi:hypothetical protein
LLQLARLFLSDNCALHMNWKAHLILSAVALVGFIVPAGAHDIVPGITGFPGLMLHPFFYTTQLIAILVAILLAARTRPIALGPIAICFATGLICTQAIRIDQTSLLYLYWLGTYISLFVIATLVAVLPRLWPGLSLLLVVPLGGVVGLGTRGDGPALSDQVEIGLASAISSIMVIVAAGWLLSRPRSDWADMFLRVAGAWIAASTAMILVSAFRA